MKPANIRALYQALANANPDPRSELEYDSPYQLLIAVMLSAQATDRSVNLATRGLFRQAPTPAAMLQLGLEGVIAHVRSIGLFNTKAANVLATSRLLLERHGGQVPGERDALEQLPGVGRKTANVVLNIAFGQRTIAVDTHVFRVANRTGLAPGDTPLAVEMKLLEVTPPQFLNHAHHWLILHGRHVCKARQPACGTCVIARWCESPPGK